MFMWNVISLPLDRWNQRRVLGDGGGDSDGGDDGGGGGGGVGGGGIVAVDGALL